MRYALAVVNLSRPIGAVLMVQRTRTSDHQGPQSPDPRNTTEKWQTEQNSLEQTHRTKKCME